MNPDVVYGKTAKGLEEMGQRTYRLPARMRALLIMIDGKTPVTEFINRAPSPDEAAANFASLVEEGFIEAKAIGPSHAAVAGRPPVAVDPLEHAKKFIVTSLVGALGPDADYFTGKVETARSMAALAEIAPKYLEVIRTGGGAKKADAFRTGLLEHGVINDALELPIGKPATAAPTPQQIDETRRLTNTKKTINRFLLDTLGPDADQFTGKVDAATSTSELRQLATRHLEVIRTAAGANKAEDFRLRVLEALNS